MASRPPKSLGGFSGRAEQCLPYPTGFGLFRRLSRRLDFGYFGREQAAEQAGLLRGTLWEWRTTELGFLTHAKTFIVRTENACPAQPTVLF